MSSLRGFQAGFRKHWMAVEALPLVLIVATVTGGGSWFLYHSAMGPTIQWTKRNPTPWNTIQPNQGTKLLEVKQTFDEKWKRDKF